MPNRFRARFVQGTALLTLTLALAACDKQEQAAPPQMPPVDVSVLAVQAERTALITELPGRVEATRVAEVRARVPGIVLKRTFEEGTDVKAGQVLFQIDPAPLQAALNAAKANLASAEAALVNAQQLEKRYAPLVKARAVSQQEYDQALAAYRQAQAAVAQQKAALEQARLNLGYATVDAPIAGRVGNALVTEGALVGQGEVTPMAVVQQIDPIYVNFTQSTNELLRLQEAALAGRLSTEGANEAPVTLVLGTGSEYKHQGKLLFSGITVDPSTGQISVRAEFPNPDKQLLPGMFVRGRVAQGVADQAISVPPQAVQRNPDGSAYVLIVDQNNTAQIRPVQAGAMMADKWVISSGLQVGDRVILNRFQQVRPGSPVKPVPVDAQAAGAAAASGAAAGTPGAAPGAAPGPDAAQGAAAPAGSAPAGAQADTDASSSQQAQ